MVKLIALLRRRPGLGPEEFRAHWRDVHGPLIASTPELARHIVRYEQHPRHRPDALSGTDGVDGVAVQWFDSIDDFVAFISEPAYQELIAELPPRFCGMEVLKFQQLVRPGDRIQLSLRFDAERGKLYFAYRNGDAPCSSGRILLGAAQ